jgi:type IV secretory pathway protease TraF
VEGVLRIDATAMKRKSLAAALLFVDGDCGVSVASNDTVGAALRWMQRRRVLVQTKARHGV